MKGSCRSCRKPNGTEMNYFNALRSKRMDLQTALNIVGFKSEHCRIQPLVGDKSFYDSLLAHETEKQKHSHESKSVPVFDEPEEEFNDITRHNPDSDEVQTLDNDLDELQTIEKDIVTPPPKYTGFY